MAAPIEREIPLSPGTDGMLATIIHRVVDGRAESTEVTAVLRRVCEESRHRPPELLVLRIKELWTKIAGAPRLSHNEKDRRYFGFIGEALVLYFGPSPSEFVARRPSPLRDDGCGEPFSWTRVPLPREPIGSPDAARHGPARERRAVFASCLAGFTCVAECSASRVLVKCRHAT